MKIHKSENNSLEMDILVGMIISERVLSAIAAKWEKGLFPDRAGGTIAMWCVDHWNKHRRCPRKDIQSIFRTRMEGKKESLVQEFETILTYLSAHHERSADEINADYLLDQAAKFFTRTKLTKSIADTQDYLASGDLDKAKECHAKFSEVSIGNDVPQSPIDEKQEVYDTFLENNEDVLIQYPGDAGKFFGDALERDGFVAVQGAEKSGKSFVLLDLAYRGMMARRRVAFFEVGDMTLRQIKKRLYSRIARHPIRSPQSHWPFVVKIPTKIKPKGTGDCADVEFSEKSFAGPLTGDISWQACKRFKKNAIRSKEKYLRMVSHPNNSINVMGIQSALQQMRDDGFLADIVVIDYADILAPPSGRMEVRDQINTTWKQLRALSQSLHCLVITATQADAASYEKNTMDRRNFSEDKRKMSHVTAMMGINMTAAEKEIGVNRWNWIVRREGEYSTRRCLHVATCLPLANPCVVSAF